MFNNEAEPQFNNDKDHEKSLTEQILEFQNDIRRRIDSYKKRIKILEDFLSGMLSEQEIVDRITEYARLSNSLVGYYPLGDAYVSENPMLYVSGIINKKKDTVDAITFNLELKRKYLKITIDIFKKTQKSFGEIQPDTAVEIKQKEEEERELTDEEKEAKVKNDVHSVAVVLAGALQIDVKEFPKIHYGNLGSSYDLDANTINIDPNAFGNLGTYSEECIHFLRYVLLNETSGLRSKDDFEHGVANEFLGRIAENYLSQFADKNDTVKELFTKWVERNSRLMLQNGVRHMMLARYLIKQDLNRRHEKFIQSKLIPICQDVAQQATNLSANLLTLNDLYFNVSYILKKNIIPDADGMLDEDGQKSIVTFINKMYCALALNDSKKIKSAVMLISDSLSLKKLQLLEETEEIDNYDFHALAYNAAERYLQENNANTLLTLIRLSDNELLKLIDKYFYKIFIA